MLLKPATVIDAYRFEFYLGGHRYEMPLSFLDDVAAELSSATGASVTPDQCIGGVSLFAEALVRARWTLRPPCTQHEGK